MSFDRSSGVLMHITSLPSPHGIGTLGQAAFDFVDFLRDAGQRYWQVLPLGHTGFGDSPYQCYSAAAGNPLMIDLDKLVTDGMLTEEEIEAADEDWNPDKVDFVPLIAARYPLLRLAYARAQKMPRVMEAVQAFRESAADWIEDYTLFMALKEEKYEGAPLWEWPDADILHREPEALEAVREELKDEIDFRVFLQAVFFAQWATLRAYAARAGVRIIGDIPIYVSPDSSDVWQHPELFKVDADFKPKKVAGVPPDYYSATGQLWGNPVYDWKAHEKTGYAWWIWRLKQNADLFDVIRIDHFRGFDTYYAIPYGAKTAQTGEWRSGPGMKLFRAVKQALGDVPIVAEDLGELFPSVYELLAESGFPGMKVLQFAFGPGDSEYLPHNHPVHCVVYTGTHDNTTAAAWYRTAAPAQRKKAAAYLGLNREEGFAAGLVRGALASPGELCIIPLADYLALGAEARINTPSTLGGSNWVWRALPGQLCAANAKKIAALAVLYGRA